jgi:hypothetical protein
LFDLRTYLREIELPDQVNGVIYAAAPTAEISYPSPYYAFEPQDRTDSIFNLFPFLAPRNDFDLMSVTEYHGDAMLLSLYIEKGALSLSSTVRCHVRFVA